MTRIGRAAALALGAAALVPGRVAHGHGAVAYRLARPPAQTNVRSPFLEHTYRVWSDLALRCPTPRQSETLAAAEAIYAVVWAWRPAPPSSEEVRAVEARTRAHWSDLERDLPTVRVRVGDSDAAVRRMAAVPLARGLERCILLRLESALPTPRALTVETPGAPPQPVELPAAGARDAVRRVVVGLNVADASTREVEFRLRDGAGRRSHAVRLPVRVFEPATVRGRILDAETGQPWPGRVHALGSDGVLRHGEAFAANATLSEKPVVFRPASYRLPFFYSDGTFEVRLPPGPARITLERGFEHPIMSRTLELRAGETREVSLASRRAMDLFARGWVSGDTHVHWVRNSWDVNEELGLLGMVQRAEDVRVVNNLTLYQYRPEEQGGSFVKPDHYPMGPVPAMCDAGWHVQMAEEYRNDNHYGHINLLGLRRLIEPIATGAGSGGPPGTPDFPTNRPAVIEARRQGGISVEAHNLGPFNASAVAANVALGLSDSLDQLDPEHYYRFLDCGFRIGLSNGSDHPARVVGCARVYARMPERGGRPLPFTYPRWLDAVRRGRTFTTSGPLLLLRVNGAQPGDVLNVAPGTALAIELRAWSRRPLGRVEIVSNGEVVRSLRTQAREATLRVRLAADRPRWVCGRASRDGQWNAILSPDVAHTSAVHVEAAGRGVLRAEAARFWIANLGEHLRRLEATGAFRNEEERRQALAESREGVARYEEIARMAEEKRAAPAAPSPPGPMAGGPIRLTPVVVEQPISRAAGMREGQDLSRVAFRLQAPWMSGPVELRFPETLRSSRGMHFLDHYLCALPPLHEWERYPEWETCPRTGALRYDFLTPEGLRIEASAEARGDTVELAFRVTNQTGAPIDRVEGNCCLDMGACPELGAKWDLSRLWASFGGALRPLSTTTPTPAEKGRQPWLLLLTERGAPGSALPKDSPTWWRVDQLVDRNLMAATSADGRHLLGYTWSVEPEALMTNGGNPCLHTGMGFSPRLAPGESFTWRGRVYCLPNDPALLLRRVDADQAAWRAMP